MPVLQNAPSAQMESTSTVLVAPTVPWGGSVETLFRVRVRCVRQGITKANLEKARANGALPANIRRRKDRIRAKTVPKDTPDRRCTRPRWESCIRNATLKNASPVDLSTGKNGVH